jgi:endonuclease YncB( thermonuclease family)
MRGGTVAALLLIGVAVGIVVSRTEPFNRVVASTPPAHQVIAKTTTGSNGTRHGTVPIVDAGEEFTCTPDRVWDGDGPLWCKEGPHIRVAGIAAREIDGSCRPYQPCPDGSPTEARDHLADLIGKRTGETPDGHILVNGAPLDCLSVGSGKGTRTAAWCKTRAGVDVSCAMVDSGFALKWDRYWGNHRCA